MAILNLNSISTAEELERIARQDLEGKTLLEIEKEIEQSDETSRVLSKAGVGYVIERGYFGIQPNSSGTPDIPHLGVEIKTSPLSIRKNGRLTVKEPLSLNIINYREEVKSLGLATSSVYRKNQKILFVWYIHDKAIPRSQYKIQYVFLWEMTSTVLSELEPDYQLILQKIRSGNAHHIHQGDHEYLTLCPKHGGKFRDPLDMKSKTKQPFSDAPAEIRAFRLKNSYMNMVIERHLESVKMTEPILSPISVAMVQIPLVGSAPCGNPLMGEENIAEYISVPKSRIKPGFKYFILRAEGDSMNLAGINPGNLVLCRQQLKADTGDRVVALLGDNVTIKVYGPRENGVRLLLPKSTNVAHLPITPEEGDTVQGVVQEVLESTD